MKLRPSIYRAALVAVTAIVMSGCRSVSPVPSEYDAAPCPPPTEQMAAMMPQAAGPACPEQSQTGYPGQPCQIGCDGNGAWMPDGLSRPWPRDEYLVDGGDRDRPVEVSPEWKVHGLESEDTIAHYDTLDGQTMVEASNQVCVYAPRFSSVRKVTCLVAGEQIVQAGGVYTPEGLAKERMKQEVWRGEKYVQLGSEQGLKPPVIFAGSQNDGMLASQKNLLGASHTVLAYQNSTMVKHGQLDTNESAVLARGVAAAIVWSQSEKVGAILNGVTAVETIKADKPFSVFSVKEPPAHPKLRLCKLASTAAAKPGEEVEFTLRFDNVGNQPIGNVVLMDNLTARLAYVEGSTDTTLEADFSIEPNVSGSSVLRWELKEALPVGKGGVIRFKCRVR